MLRAFLSTKIKTCMLAASYVRSLFEVDYVFTAEVTLYQEQWNKVTKS